MADTVRFMTWNDTGTPANSSGANGFPAPLNSSAAVDVYGTQVSFQDCIKWYWRVKEWELTTDFSVSGPDGTAFLTSPQTATVIIGPTTEIDLINQGSYKQQNATGRGGTNVASGTIAVIRLFQGTSGELQPAIKFSDPDYFPWIKLEAVVATTTNGFIQFNTIQSDVSPPDGSLTAVLDGYNVTLYYKSFLDPGTTFTATTMVWAPKTFWPYAALSDGTPIYDTSTGAQLQSPTN